MPKTNDLNSEQKRAVETTKGPLLILAGAGAGKTKTLTERIVHIVKSGVSPREVLAITFTNKAASEMRERVFSRLAEEKTLNNPVSITEKPFISTFHALGVHILKENAVLLGLPRHFGIFDKDDSKKAVRDALRALDLDPKQYEPGKILSAISREKGNGISWEEFAERAKEDFWSGLIVQVWRKYEETLMREKALDFDDLLLRIMKVLRDKKVREHYQKIWKYIHIDEYQDTNGVQYQIAKLLSEKEKNICVVGDIDQNIYSWRGAKLRNILDFEKDYPEAVVVVLEENYRSTQTILHVANHIIKKNKFRKEKNLFTKNVPGEPLSLFEGFDEVSEAEFVATQCEKLISSGVSPEQIAVLYRANFQSRALEEAFLAYGVKYQLLGTKFFEGKSDLLPAGVRGQYQNFLLKLKSIGEAARNLLPSETLKIVLKESGMEEMLHAGGEDDHDRLENVRELVTLAKRYDGNPGEMGIEAFLTNAALQSDQDALDTPQEGVKLMTVHASKGLEFDYVFITGLEENLFPHMGIDDEEVATEDDEEERRLFYVALTRARKKIYLSYAQTRMLYGSRQVNVPSEFVFDVPQDMIVREEGTFGLLRKPIFSIDF